MDKFYGDDIEKISEEYLLKATPYIAESRINFGGKLTPEIFFAEDGLFSDRIKNSNDPEVDAENDKFDSDVDACLKNVDNIFAKVDLIHIAGYGGCGKTTYLRHLLWNMEKERKIVCDVVDFEGANNVAKPIITKIMNEIYEHENAVYNFFDALINGNLFDISRFDSVRRYMESFAEDIKDARGNAVENKLFNQKKDFDEYNEYVYYLMVIFFFIQICKKRDNCNKEPFIIVFDNADSISSLKEEQTFISALKVFVNDCNFFFGNNISNTRVYREGILGNIIDNSKFVFFLTTRVVTIKRYLELEPDLEKVYGWCSLKMPENYYSHKCIIDKRVEYYSRVEGEKTSAKIEGLKTIRDMTNIAYKSYNFKRLFNGNLRFCIDTLCKLATDIFGSIILKDGKILHNESSRCPEAAEGVNGVWVSVLFNYFKEKGIYQEKLHLSECQYDKRISLSRIILTIVREKGGSCSMVTLFHMLTSKYSIDEICRTVWDLSEAKRDCWRRLITFNVNFPSDCSELIRQGEKTYLKDKDYSVEMYSEIDICTSGKAYLEYIVPHFEFMLSRHRYRQGNIKVNPLFCRSSETILENSGKNKYVFENIIDTVFYDVSDCCKNATCFSDEMIKNNKLDETSFIGTSYFNFHAINRDGTIGARQSYESRLIFSHFGYIERYRRYLLWKKRNEPEEIRADINKRIVERLSRYLELYNQQRLCYRTRAQDRAATALSEHIGSIKESKYRDFDTKIEADSGNNEEEG
jgi:energy-coupling factor transporter ATP-binding protein EcfA2